MTYRTVRQLRLLGQGWHLLGRQRVGGFDIDHLVVGPDRVLTVTTKWVHPFSAPGHRTGAAEAWLDRSRRAASVVAMFLRQRAPRVPVKPLLVLWGPGVPTDLAASRTLYGVRVVVGAKGPEWRAELQRPETQTLAGRVVDTAPALAAFGGRPVHVPGARPEPVAPQPARVIASGTPRSASSAG